MSLSTQERVLVTRLIIRLVYKMRSLSNEKSYDPFYYVSWVKKSTWFIFDRRILFERKNLGIIWPNKQGSRVRQKHFQYEVVWITEDNLIHYIKKTVTEPLTFTLNETDYLITSYTVFVSEMTQTYQRKNSKTVDGTHLVREVPLLRTRHLYYFCNVSIITFTNPTIRSHLKHE